MLPIITTLGDRTVADMLTRAQDLNVRARQADATRRVLMMSENWRELVWSHINDRVKTPAVRQALRARVLRTYNVFLQIIRRVCVAYKVKPLRTLDGAIEQSQQAWSALGIESRIATIAKHWERQTFGLNVIIVVPRVIEDPSGLGRRLTYRTILPDRCEVYTDDRDPMGGPTKIAFWEKYGSDYERNPLRMVTLDDEAWRYYDHRGVPIETVPHGAGIFPGAVWRLDEPVDDWWSSFRGEGIVDASIEVAYIAARRDWVRGGQDRKKEIFAAENLHQVPQQVAGAEGPLHIPLAQAAFRYEILDGVTSIDEFEKHIKSYLHQAAEYLGVPSVLVDFEPQSGNQTNEGGMAQQHAALADVRADHIDYYRQAETDLAWKTALVLRGQRHPMARLLPPDMVRESFRIDYPELTFVETPIARAQVSKERISLGLSSTFREYQREHPELTLDEARTAVLAMAAEEGELNQYYIEHNIPREAGSRQRTLAQLQGAQGGEASGEARSNDDEDDTDDDADQPGRAADEPD